MASRQYTDHTMRISGAGSTSGAMLWAGRIISALVFLFMLQDGLIKALNLDFAVDAMVDLGYPENTVVPVGIAALVATVLYAIPRTAPLGAILLTGFLGGAIATQARLEDAWLIFPAALAALVWLGLVLRDRETRRLLLP